MTEPQYLFVSAFSSLYYYCFLFSYKIDGIFDAGQQWGNRINGKKDRNKQESENERE
jgi:hypothetical protein